MLFLLLFYFGESFNFFKIKILLKRLRSIIKKIACCQLPDYPKPLRPALLSRLQFCGRKNKTRAESQKYIFTYAWFASPTVMKCNFEKIVMISINTAITVLEIFRNNPSMSKTPHASSMPLGMLVTQTPAAIPSFPEAQTKNKYIASWSVFSMLV